MWGFQAPRTTLNPFPCLSFLFPYRFSRPVPTAGSLGARVPRSLGGGGARPGPAPSACSAPSPPACLPAPAPPQCFQLRAWAAAAALDFRGARQLWEAHFSARAFLRPPSPCNHEGAAQRVSGSRPPRIAAVRALVARAGGKRGWPKLGQAQRRDAGLLGVGEPPPRVLAAPLQVRPRGLPLGAGLAVSPLSLALGWARREKAAFSPYPEGTARSPCGDWGRGSFLLLSGLCGPEPDKLFLNRRPTSRREGVREALPSIALRVPKGQLSA